LILLGKFINKGSSNGLKTGKETFCKVKSFYCTGQIGYKSATHDSMIKSIRNEVIIIAKKIFKKEYKHSLKK